jgi:hypothetical protein
MRYDAVHVMSGLDVPWSGATGHRKADIRRQFYLVDDEERDIHFRGAYEIAADRWSPLHRHTFEQIRYQLGGDQTYGSHRWNAGTFGYFPEAVHYGPHTSGPGGFQEVDLQWQSPTGGYFGSNDELVSAMKALKERGVEFANGLALWPDGRKQDSTEACWEQLLGGKIEYAAPRYREPIFIETANLPWRPTRQRGVERRRIGAFDGLGPEASLIRLLPGAETAAGKAGENDRYQVRFVVEGEITYEGKRCPTVSCLYYPPQVGYAPMKSEGGATVLLVQIQPKGGAPLAPEAT